MPGPRSKNVRTAPTDLRAGRVKICPDPTDLHKIWAKICSDSQSDLPPNFQGSSLRSKSAEFVRVSMNKRRVCTRFHEKVINLEALGCYLSVHNIAPIRFDKQLPSDV
jgi:hypothetical protein